MSSPLPGQAGSAEPESQLAPAGAQPHVSHEQAPAPQSQPHLSRGVSVWGLFRSELTKLRTLRSTWWNLGIILVLAIGMSFLAGYFGGFIAGEDIGLLPKSFRSEIAAQSATASLGFTMLVAGVFGSLLITGEYSSGMIRSTFLAAPTRVPVLLVKATLLFVWMFLVGCLTTFGGFLLTKPLRAGTTLDFPLNTEGYVRAFFSGGLLLACISVFAFAVGVLVRSTAGTISIVVGVLFVLPLFAAILSAFKPESQLMYLLPSNAGNVLTSVGSNFFSGMQTPPYGEALAVLLVWAFAPLAAALAVAKVRDV